MKSAKAVIGLGFGDEGKGMMVNYLCSHVTNPIVVRYSGGQQAAHTVWADNHQHVFSNFGAGSLQGVPTYWSKYCTVDPSGALNELELLLDVCNPSLYIDPKAPVTTPYEKHFAQNDEKTIANGTCGVGVGATHQREEDFYHLLFEDLYFPKQLRWKLDRIKDYYGFADDVDIWDFIRDCEDFLDSSCVSLSDQSILDGYTPVFEGSQGLLLDQHYGFFPHVTRSNTGTKNILEMGYRPECYLMTRGYQTRHGNGPMSNEQYAHLLDYSAPHESNQANTYQGKFRTSVLDIDLLQYAIRKDNNLKGLDCTLVVTCLDQMNPPYPVTIAGNIYQFKSANEFISFISNKLDARNLSDLLISTDRFSTEIKSFNEMKKQEKIDAE